MENSYMTFSLYKGLDFRAKTLDALFSYMQNSNEIWVIKDKESRFIYMNDYTVYHTGLPKGFNVEGKLDSECPAPWADFADIIQANDKNVMDNQKTIPVLNTFIYGGREKIIQPFMVEVTPLIKDGESIGVVAHGKKLEIYSMYHLENNKCPDSLTFGNPTDLFTDREFDVVFLALQSLSAKEIARRLDISHNTVGNYLSTIYEKTGVSSLAQLVAYCRSKGCDKYAPGRLINSCPYIPLA